jgi:hypothetical protein
MDSPTPPPQEGRLALHRPRTEARTRQQGLAPNKKHKLIGKKLELRKLGYREAVSFNFGCVVNAVMWRPAGFLGPQSEVTRVNAT